MSVCDGIIMSRTTTEEKKCMTSKNGKGRVETVVAACGWGLFFIWTGIALFTHVGWGAGLLGVGIITLGAQATRKYFGLRLDVFWVTVGFFFVIGGVWELLNVQFGIIPILCVAVGFVLIVSTLVRKPGRDSSAPVS